MITKESETDSYPVASLEDATLANESLYYGSLDTGRVNKSTIGGYPNDTYTNPNNYIQQLSGASGAHTVGANIVLKVMAGDTKNPVTHPCAHPQTQKTTPFPNSHAPLIRIAFQLSAILD